MIKTAVSLILSSVTLAGSGIEDEQASSSLEIEKLVQAQKSLKRDDENQAIITVECSGMETVKSSIPSEPKEYLVETQVANNVYRVDVKSKTVEVWNGGWFDKLCKENCISRINDKEVRIKSKHDLTKITMDFDFKMNLVAGNAVFSILLVAKNNGVAFSWRRVDHEYDKCVTLKGDLSRRLQPKF
jgi:hypothetical protein